MKTPCFSQKQLLTISSSRMYDLLLPLFSMRLSDGWANANQETSRLRDYCLQYWTEYLRLAESDSDCSWYMGNEEAVLAEIDATNHLAYEELQHASQEYLQELVQPNSDMQVLDERLQYVAEHYYADSPEEWTDADRQALLDEIGEMYDRLPISNQRLAKEGVIRAIRMLTSNLQSHEDSYYSHDIPSRINCWGHKVTV